MLEEELAWFCILCAGTGLVLLDVDEAALVTVCLDINDNR